MKFKKVVPFYYDKDGVLNINMSANEADADWLFAARLAEKAEKGDVEAQKELERMMKAPMYEVGEEGPPEESDWDDPTMSEEQWATYIKEEREASGEKKFWFSTQNIRDKETLEVSPYGLPIGVWILDKQEVKAFYLEGFREYEKAAKKWIEGSQLPASKQIRYNYERSSTYGDWWTLGQTSKEYDSAEAAAGVILKEMKDLWE